MAGPMFRRLIQNSRRLRPDLASGVDRSSKSLPLLQVFHDWLLFLTFLPGAVRWSRF